MRSYLFKEEMTTIADAAQELGVWRQTVLRWIKKLDIPHEHLWQGRKCVATFFPVKYMPYLREQSFLHPKPNRIRED